MTLRLIDLREPDGPYWAAYQHRRHRDHIIDNPDYVPEWFLFDTLSRRFAAGRVEIEHLMPLAHQDRDDPESLSRVRAALYTLENFMRSGSNRVGQREAVTAAMLGAQEIEEERERLQHVEQAGRDVVESTSGQPYRFGGDPAGFDGSALAERVAEVAVEHSVELVGLKRRPLREALCKIFNLPPGTSDSELIVTAAVMMNADSLAEQQAAKTNGEDGPGA